MLIYTCSYRENCCQYSDSEDAKADKYCDEECEYLESTEVASKLLLADELERVRQWFDVVQDLNPAYLEKKDFVLAKKLYEKLSMRVPNSIQDSI